MFKATAEIEVHPDDAKLMFEEWFNRRAIAAHRIKCIAFRATNSGQSRLVFSVAAADADDTSLTDTKI